MIAEALSWWFLSVVLAATAYPLLASLRSDCAYALSRGVGLLLLTYVTWLLGHVRGLDQSTAALGLVVIAIPPVAALLRGSGLPGRREVLGTEAVFAAFFLFFLVTRLYSPEILYTGGEKFMDYGFMRSVGSGAVFPPGDPWMAGSEMFYYYMGYVAAADIKLLTGVPWDESFNLLVPFFAGVAATSAYGLSRVLGARLLPLVALASGNAASVVLVAAPHLPPSLASGLAKAAGTGNVPAEFSYFSASRVIPGTINEFPFFTFLHADPHAHMYSIPFQMTHLGLLAVYLGGRDADDRFLLPLLALSLGVFYPLNTWEFPTYALLTAAVLVMRSGLVPGLARSAATAAASVVLFLPYHLAMETSRSVALAAHRTPLAAFLGVNGILLAMVLLYLRDRMEGREFLVTLVAVVPSASRSASDSSASLRCCWPPSWSWTGTGTFPLSSSPPVSSSPSESRCSGSRGCTGESWRG